MSSNVTLNGVQYVVPAYNDTGWAQGVGNLSLYLVAIASNTLQPTGGAFTLTSELDFGANFGVKQLYLKSETANPASAGVVRLAKTDSIKWRNNANGADIALAIDGSDNLQYNATKVLLSGAVVNADINAAAAIAYSKLALTGSIVNADINASAAIAYTKLALSASIVNADVATAAAIAYSKLAALTTSRALQTNSGTGFIEVSSVTNTELGYLSGVTSAIQTQLNATVANPLTSNLAAGSHKITGLAAPTTAGDAIPLSTQVTMNAAGYLIGTVVQSVQVTDTTSVTSVGTSYTTTNTAASITPKSTTHKIRISVTGNGNSIAYSTSNSYFTIAKGGSNLGATNGFTFMSGNTGTVVQLPVCIVYMDSPATTSSTTYALQIKSDIAAKCSWNGSSGTCVILLEEIAY